MALQKYSFDDLDSDSDVEKDEKNDSDSKLIQELMSKGFRNVRIVQDPTVINRAFGDGDCLFAERYALNECKGGYQRGSFLGEGKGGTVFKASCGGRENYAAKLVKFSSLSDKLNFFREVLNQIEISQINRGDPLAPVIHEILLCKDKAIFIMDILLGQTLEDYLKSLDKKREREDIIKALQKVNDKLTQLYGSRWLHRDLHSRNILMLIGDRIRFVDFDRSVKYKPDDMYFNSSKTLELEMFRKDLTEILGDEYKSDVHTLIAPSSVPRSSLIDIYKSGSMPEGKRIITFGQRAQPKSKDSDSDSDRYKSRTLFSQKRSQRKLSESDSD